MSLPSGYTRLEYIKSSGTQYADTGFTPNQDTSVDITAALTDVSDSYGFLYGAGEQYNARAFECYVSSGQYEFNYAAQYPFLETAAAGQKIHIVHNKNDLALTIGSTLYTHTFTYSSFTAPYTLTLFAIHRATLYYGKAKIYSCKIYDNGTLVRDYIPCKNVSGTVGLWDDVNSQFYGNAGTGTFTAGPAVLGSHKTMVGGTIYDVTGGKCMVGGTVYDVQKGLTMVGGTVYEIPFTVEPAVPVGTTWTITSSQSWEVPATGNYQVELHGGGGGRGGRYSEGSYSMYGAGGGGSGELYTTALMAGSIVPITIGLGGSNGANTIKSWIYSGNDGEASSFGSLFSIAGGGGGSKDNIIGPNRGGTASGSLATAGGDGVTDYSMEDKPVTGGYGNRYNTGQTYGNGASKYVLSQPGACIITYLGT